MGYSNGTQLDSSFSEETIWSTSNGGNNGASELMVKDHAVETFYAELVEFAFDRDAELDSWAWDLELQEPMAETETVALAIRRLCINSGEELKNFSDLQVAGGLTYIFSNSFSDYSFSILNREVSSELRSSFFESLNLLFANCFEPRCSLRLSHESSHVRDNPLNDVCYMFWDTSPLSNGGLDALHVMEKSIYLRNIACIESGLHGLGHAFHKNEMYVESVIDKFLKSSPKIDEKLLNYAMNARRGYVQ